MVSEFTAYQSLLTLPNEQLVCCETSPRGPIRRGSHNFTPLTQGISDKFQQATSSRSASTTNDMDLCARTWGQRIHKHRVWQSWAHVYREAKTIAPYTLLAVVLSGTHSVEALRISNSRRVVDRRGTNLRDLSHLLLLDSADRMMRSAPY